MGWLGKAWIAGVLAYAVLRALIVWPTLGEYGVSPWAFLVIDVGTAWPYAYGQVRVVTEARALNWGGMQLWAAIAMLSFIAPYAYIVGAGSGDMPLLAWIGQHGAASGSQNVRKGGDGGAAAQTGGASPSRRPIRSGRRRRRRRKSVSSPVPYLM